MCILHFTISKAACTSYHCTPSPKSTE